MDVSVEAANHENFIVVFDWVAVEEIFRLAEGALNSLDLSGLGIELETVRNPSVVSTKDKDFWIVQSEAAHGVSRWPLAVLIDDLKHLPFLFIQVKQAIQSLNTIQWRLRQRVTSSNDVQKSGLNDANRMVMSALIQLANLSPFVFRNVVNFTLLGSLIWVFGTNSEHKVFGLVFKPLVKVGQLVAWSAVLHAGSALDFVSLLINQEALIWHNSANLILLLLTTNKEYLILCLNWREILGNNIGVAKINLGCLLRV